MRDTTKASPSEMGGLALLFHPLAMNSFRHWMNLLRNSGGIDPASLLRSAVITSASPFWAPLRMAEKLAYGRRVQKTEIAKPPVFILGHWRTGTTLLHYLMSKDPNFGGVTLFQTLVPASFLVGRHFLQPLMRAFVPAKRPMDNMDLALDLPQEEEYAICNLCEYSLYVGWYFPKRMPELFEKYVLFDGVHDSIVKEWKNIYLNVLKKATLHSQGKPLLLKNPANTARIAMLLDMFPNAKFIHIHRDPLAVYRSTYKLHRSVIDMVGLQKLSDDEIFDNVVSFYSRMMRRYLDQKTLIPEKNLVEVRYENLERQPLQELQRIYSELGLPDWDAAKPHIEAHATSQKNYVKNTHSFTAHDIERVKREWGFAFDHWGYDLPKAVEANPA